MKISSVNGRPVNLDIKTIALPVTAYASILHRVTGILLCAGVLVLLWMLQKSLASEVGFAEVQQLLGSPLMKLVLTAILAPFIYHLVAGIRHLLMDAGIGESLEGGQAGAKAVFAVSIVLIIATGAWLWLA